MPKYIIDSKKYKAILFDWDGTIVDTEVLQNEANSKLFAPFGIKYLSVEEHINKLGGKGFKSVYEEFVGSTSDEEYEKVKLLRRKHYLEILDKKGVKVIDGALKFIIRAKEVGIKVGIVTGGSKETLDEVFNRLKELSSKLFDIIVYFGDYKNTKPHPEPFLLGVSKLGVEPNECLVFENAPNGVRSAIAAGMDYFAITHNLPENKFRELDPNAKTIKDFTEVKIV